MSHICHSISHKNYEINAFYRAQNNRSFLFFFDLTLPKSFRETAFDSAGVSKQSLLINHLPKSSMEFLYSKLKIVKLMVTRSIILVEIEHIPGSNNSKSPNSRFSAVFEEKTPGKKTRSPKIPVGESVLRNGKGDSFSSEALPNLSTSDNSRAG